MGTGLPLGGHRGRGGEPPTPRLTDREILLRLREARVAVLATVGLDGRPHQVPVTLALDGDLVYTAVDQKPKTSRALKRLENIAANPSVGLLVQEYVEEWGSLWWCRLDGVATIHHGGLELTRAREVLSAKYVQYATEPPEGPAIVIRAQRMTGWRARNG